MLVSEMGSQTEKGWEPLIYIIMKKLKYIGEAILGGVDGRED